jgi:hypothetical protein
MWHAVRNEGSTVARCVGFFSGARVQSTFADALMPPGFRTFDTGDIPPAMPFRPDGGPDGGKNVLDVRRSSRLWPLPDREETGFARQVSHP